MKKCIFCGTFSEGGRYLLSFGLLAAGLLFLFLWKVK